MHDRAMGYWHTTIAYRLAGEKKGALSGIVNQALPLRDKLLKTATYLWADHPIIGKEVASIRRSKADAVYPVAVETRCPVF